MADAVAKMVAPLDDVHVWLETPAGRRSIAPPLDTPPPALPELTETVHRRAGHLVGRIGDVGYVLVGNLQRGIDDLERAIAKLDDARAMVLDLRFNGGGNERLGWRIARRWVEREVVFGKVAVRDPTLPGLAGFRDAIEQRFEPEGAQDHRPVAVLQGPHCVSSGEGMLMLLRAAGTRTVGLPSRGASGNPQPFHLTEGLAVWTPTWRRLLPDGTPIEGRGVPPAIRVDDPAAALAKALSLLR
jgi:C-terminal processing protease CtpA/Prc